MKEYIFPDPCLAGKEGLVVRGGDLSIDCLISAYRNGIFPWFNENDPLLWWSPDPRLVIIPEKLRVSRRLKKIINTSNFTFTFDQCFEQVIKSCAQPRANHATEATWIDNRMTSAYIRLHHAGYAHSLECWHGSDLCGGLYGVALGRIFFGESMFSTVSESSKLSLIVLIKQLHKWNYTLLDCQLPSDLMFRLGGEYYPRNEFTKIVRENTRLLSPTKWHNETTTLDDFDI